MYRIEDRAAYIRVLQGFLNIPQSGRFDARTTHAVLVHQKENALPQTGKVDYRTFLSIKAEYKRSLAIRDTDEFDRQPYAFGMYGEDVGMINSMLASVLPIYSIDITPPRGRYYGIDTENTVKFLRTVFMQKASTEADSEFIGRLKKEYSVLNFKKNINM